MTDIVHKRYYKHAKSDLRMIQKFADALRVNGVVRVEGGDMLTPIGYTIFPDGVRFECKRSAGLATYNPNHRKHYMAIDINR